MTLSTHDQLNCHWRLIFGYPHFIDEGRFRGYSKKICWGSHLGSSLRGHSKVGGVLFLFHAYTSLHIFSFKFRRPQKSLGLLISTRPSPRAPALARSGAASRKCVLSSSDSQEPAYCQLLGGVPTQSPEITFTLPPPHPSLPTERISSQLVGF